VAGLKVVAEINSCLVRCVERARECGVVELFDVVLMRDLIV
jgi:hypothetical protein